MPAGARCSSWWTGTCSSTPPPGPAAAGGLWWEGSLENKEDGEGGINKKEIPQTGTAQIHVLVYAYIHAVKINKGNETILVFLL